jgi:hypothetical protein
MKVCVDRVGAFGDISEGSFHMPSPPNIGTTGVTKELRSGGAYLISTCSSIRLIIALERRKGAAHRGDIDIHFSALVS